MLDNPVVFLEKYEFSSLSTKGTVENLDIGTIFEKAESHVDPP